jgi:hypothetical protein
MKLFIATTVRISNASNSTGTLYEALSIDLPRHWDSASVFLVRQPFFLEPSLYQGTAFCERFEVRRN